jgi:nitroimidazol reductase NimA-like FMN-containing flavoprotein (pyridoxamine 5'-phosphate oxidase superfamily)
MKKQKQRLRPFIPDYGIETSEKGILEWDFVEKELLDSKQYWLSTVTPEGKPHAIPIWGVWFNTIFYFGGGPKTKNRKNLEKNPNIVVHTESGARAVIIEGIVELETDEKINNEIIKIYKEKYKLDHPAPFWKVEPIKVLAWTIDDYAGTPTKWILT